MNQGSVNTSYFYLGYLSMACFILAGLTGFLYRLGLIGWLPGGLGLQNIRHAHSHLMFFGWAVPFPMYILLQDLWTAGSQHNTGLRWMKAALSGGLLFGLLAYPFFLFYGYRPVEMGPAAFPLSVIFSGLVMICWYIYMWEYVGVRHLLTDHSRPWFDGALLMLFICSLGAWGIAVIQAVDPTRHLLIKGLTHFFLATFTEGWVVLILLAILISKQPLKKEHGLAVSHLPLGLICIGAPLTFPYGIPDSLLSPLLLTVARLGGILSAVGLAMVLFAIFRSNSGDIKVWLWSITLLALKAIMQCIACVLPSSFWMSDHGLRIFYLHVLLLGALTLTLTGWLQMKFKLPNQYFTAITTSVSLTLLSLILPTRPWPAGWSGRWIFYALAGAALLPVLAVSVQWIKIIILSKSKTASG